MAEGAELTRWRATLAGIAHIAVLDILGLDKPAAMTGHSLIASQEHRLSAN